MTAGQYADFLNAVDPTGANALGLYNTLMNSDNDSGCQITWNAGSSAYDFSGAPAPKTSWTYENGPVNYQHAESSDLPVVGNTRVLSGQYAGAMSPIDAPVDFNYFDVALDTDELWEFQPPADHDVAWLYTQQGSVRTEASLCQEAISAAVRAR